jgi:hypothetical protein
MSDTGAPDTVLATIKKLFQLAAKNNNEHEAAQALAKANALCEQWNLDVERVQQGEQKDGKREKAAVDGGMYKFQEELWSSVAALNFCLHWVEPYYNERTKTRRRRHVLVGRKVNTAISQATAQYLQGAVERLTMERVGGDNNQRFSRWAVSYRRGMVRKLCEKVEEKRRTKLREERRRKAEAERTGTSTSTDMVLSTYIDAETDANNDFILGEGWSARQAQRRAEAAEARRLAEEERTRWAAEHPEEAAAEAAKRRTEADRYWKKHSSRRSSRLSSERDDTDRSAFFAGYDQADHISLDPQVADPRPAPRLAGGAR